MGVLYSWGLTLNCAARVPLWTGEPLLMRVRSNDGLGACPIHAPMLEQKTMTKKIRIENADTSDHKVVVLVVRKGVAADGGMNAPDETVSEHAINYPTNMVEVYVHSGQYLVVREVVPSDA